MLNDSRIHKHMQEIDEIIESGQNNIIKLQNICKHAYHTVPFYSRCMSSEYESFPIINKQIIKNNFNDFVSNKYRIDQLKSVVTSGSTGTPFKVLQDTVKRERTTADTLYFSKLAGYNFGDKLYYLKIWNKINQKSYIQKFFQNIVSVDVLNLSDKFISDLIIQLEKDRSKKNFLGYSSAFDAILSYCNRYNIKPDIKNVSSIISMSESLSPYTKEGMEHIFSSSMVSRYSNVENGIIAQQIKNKDNFLLNNASYYIEIYDFEKDIPVNDGEMGRIVITDLFNYGMPIIKYDTGDIGSLDKLHKKKFLSQIEGRKMDTIYSTSKQLISSFTITNNMWKYHELKQYQFIQSDVKMYTFKLNVDTTFNREQELINEFKTYLGSDAVISIEYVDEIPLLNSGKRRKVVNLMDIHHN